MILTLTIVLAALGIVAVVAYKTISDFRNLTVILRTLEDNPDFGSMPEVSRNKQLKAG